MDIPPLSTLTTGLPQHSADRVLRAFDQGLAYVWGRQDSGAEPRDMTRSEKFAYAYAMSQRRILTGEYHHHTNLQDAYETWSRSRVIYPELLTCGTLGKR